MIYEKTYNITVSISQHTLLTSLGPSSDSALSMALKMLALLNSSPAEVAAATIL